MKTKNKQNTKKEHKINEHKIKSNTHKNHTHIKKKCTYLIRIPGAEVDGDESEPDDTSRVHSKSNKLALVEILGDLTCLDGIHGAGGDEEHVVDERQQERGVLDAALKNHLLTCRVFKPRAWRLYDKPHHRRHHLRETEERDDKEGRMEGRREGEEGKEGGRNEWKKMERER